MEHMTCDVLVIGGGTAGCFAAVSAKKAGADVLVADKASGGYAGASIMASGFWSVFNPDWGMDYDATLCWINKNSSYLNNRDWTELFLRESWQTYLDLQDWGVPFPVPEKEIQSFFQKSIIGDDAAGHHDDDPHTHYGIVPLRHRAVTPALRNYAEGIGVHFLDRVMITDLLERDGRVFGAQGFPLETGKSFVIRAKATVLAAGRNYFKSPGMNISGQTGDADAMGYRAGAVLSGKEFPDMHMNIARHPMWKGNGEVYPAYFQFEDAMGRRLPNRGFDLSLASTIHAGYGPILWDFGKATENDLRAIDEYLKKRGNPKEIERVGLDPRGGGQYPMIGGAAAGGCQEHTAGLWPFDTDCASNLTGLYSAGDSCATWVWGAIVQGPPPGLAPAAITGKRAGKAAARFARASEAVELEGSELGVFSARAFRWLERKSGYDPRWVIQLLQNYMMPWYVLHIKSAERLTSTLELVRFLRGHMIPRMKAADPHELRLAHEADNMSLNAEMILRSSRMREESRGWHFREDFPSERDEWLAWVLIRKDENGEMVLSRAPVPEQWRPSVGTAYASRWLAWEHPHGEEEQKWQYGL
ncbi:MAG: nadB 1 [Oscillospiraceae bacterium]|nr:nadB 1 [Oscillospiraceae bacterium]